MIEERQNNITYPYHEVLLFGSQVPTNLTFWDPNSSSINVEIHPKGDFQKLRTLASIKLEISEKLNIPIRFVRILVSPTLFVETEEKWIELCEAIPGFDRRESTHGIWDRSYYRYFHIFNIPPKLEKIISNCKDAILSMEEYELEIINTLYSSFEDLLAEKGQDDDKINLCMGCIEAFKNFYEKENFFSLEILENISKENKENFEAALPFLIHIGCHLAKNSYFEQAFSVLFPIREEHPKAIVALADLLFREGENYFIHQDPGQEIFKIRKQKYQLILHLLKDLNREVLLKPEVSFMFEQSIKGLFSGEHNVFDNCNASIGELLGGVDVSISELLWTTRSFKEVSQSLIQACQDQGVQEENIALLENLLEEGGSFENLMLLLEELLSYEEIREACSELQLIKDFLEASHILPFETLLHGEKEDVQENENYFDIKRIKYFSNKKNDFDVKAKELAQVIIDCLEPGVLDQVRRHSEGYLQNRLSDLDKLIRDYNFNRGGVFFLKGPTVEAQAMQTVIADDSKNIFKKWEEIFKIGIEANLRETGKRSAETALFYSYFASVQKLFSLLDPSHYQETDMEAYIKDPLAIRADIMVRSKNFLNKLVDPELLFLGNAGFCSKCRGFLQNYTEEGSYNDLYEAFRIIFNQFSGFDFTYFEIDGEANPEDFFGAFQEVIQYLGESSLAEASQIDSLAELLELIELEILASANKSEEEVSPRSSAN